MASPSIGLRSVLEAIEFQGRMTRAAIELSGALLVDQMSALMGQTAELPGADENRIVAREGRLDERLSWLETVIEKHAEAFRSGYAPLATTIHEVQERIQELSVEVHQLLSQAHENSADIASLATRMAVLCWLEERVAALEKRTG